MSALGVALRWRRREPPLPVAAVLLRNADAPAFIDELLDRDIDPALRLCFDDEWLLALGPSSSLPWLEAAIWLGRDGSLLVPTTQQTELPAELVARQIAAQAPFTSVMVATPEAMIATTLAATSPTPDALAQWLADRRTP